MSDKLLSDKWIEEWLLSRFGEGSLHNRKFCRELIDDTTKLVAEGIFREVRKLWKPQHHNLCYGIIKPHPDCVCCKLLALKEKWLK